MWYLCQGVKPASFDKVEASDVKDVIENCIRPRREDRPSVKELLTHSFFEEDCGLRVEVVSQDEKKIVFRLRVLDPKKRTHKHKENEAIQFEFDLQTDRYDTISEEMVSFIYLFSFFLNLLLFRPNLASYLKMMPRQWVVYSRYN